MNLKALLLINLILANCFLAFTQISFTHYTTEDGLPHDFTFRVTQDREGMLWVATDGGLAGYDGNKFLTLDQSDGLANNYVVDVDNYSLDTKVFSIWKAGIHFLKNDTVYVPRITGYKKNNLRHIEVLDKDIVGSNEGIHYLFKHQKDFHFTTKTYYFGQYQDSIIFQGVNSIKEVLYSEPKVVDNTLFFYGGYNYSEKINYLSGIYKFDFEKEIAEEVFPFLKDYRIYDFGKLTNDQYYAVTQNTIFIFDYHGIVREDTYAVPFGFIRNYIKTSYCELFVITDSKTGNDRVFIKKKNDTSNLIEISRPHEAKINIGMVFLDQDEQIWITSKADGLYKIQKELLPVRKSLFTDEHIISLAQSPNDLALLTLNFIHLYHKKNGEIHSTSTATVNTKFKNKRIFDRSIILEREIKENSLNQYILSSNECSIVLGNKSKAWYDLTEVNWQNQTSTELHYRLNDKQGYIKQVAIEKDTILWLGTTQGLIQLDTSGKHYLSSHCQLQNTFIKKLLYDQHRKGIWVLTKNKLFFLTKDNIREYDKTSGIVPIDINDLLLDYKGTLWAATQNGISLLQEDLFYNYHKNDKFLSSFTSSLLEEDKYLWVAGNKGVVKIDNSKAFTPIASPNIKVNFNNRYELISKIIDLSGYAIVTEYAINNGGWKPLNDDILDVGNLAFGTYSLQVRSRNEMSQWKVLPPIKFELRQEWYKSTFFVITVCVLCFLLIYYIRSVQLQKAYIRNQALSLALSKAQHLENKLGKVRRDVAKDFHDELGNRLAGIMVQAEMATEDPVIKTADSFHLLKRIKQDADQLFLGVKDFVWTIDSKSDFLHEFVVYLSDFGYELFENTKVSFSVIHLINSQETVVLPYYWSRELLFMFKEAMTNCLVHSKAQKAILEFFLKDDILEIHFRDNGKGFDYEKIKRKNGLINMVTRAEKIGGELFIISKKGTQIIFKGNIKIPVSNSLNKR